MLLLDAALADADGASVSDVHMHRAQLRVIRRDLEAAKNDLEACIAVAPGHVLARLRLATVLIHSGADAQSVEEQVEAAERLAPTMSEVYQVKGEVLLAKADLRGAIRQFDEAIRLDESNPVPLYNKGLTLIQMNQFEAHNAQKLFESALAVDPTCMVALMRLSELKRNWRRPSTRRKRWSICWGAPCKIVGTRTSWWSCPPCARWRSRSSLLLGMSG